MRVPPIEPIRPEDLGFGRLFADMHEALFVVQDDTIVLWNPAAERLFGFSHADSVGQSLRVLFGNSDWPRVSAAVDDIAGADTAARQPGSRDLQTVRGITASGRELVLELSLSLVERPTCSSRYVLALARDITERVRSQEIIEQRSRDLQERSELLDLAQDAIFVRDFQSGALRYWNRGAEQLYGWHANDAIGAVSHELLRTRFPEPLQAIEAALAVQGHWEGELVHTARDGRQVIVGSRWTVRRDASGAPVAILEVNTDVTERKRGEEMLRDQAALLDLAPNAIYVRDFATGEIRFWNDGAESLYGCSREGALGHTAEELIRTRFPGSLAEIESTLQASGRWEGELEQLTRDGRQVTVASRWALRHDEHGQPRDILVINTDITEQKRDEVELARLAAAEAALSERDHLLATVSHDLKTPLTAIRGQADILLRHLDRTGELEPERARRGLELLRTAATRMASWIDELLDSARLEAGRPLELRREPMDLVALAWQAISEHQRSTEQQRLRVETSEPKLIGVWDPARLRRAVDNLLSNALKYSPNGGDITIRVAVEPGENGKLAVLSVHDHGVGIPESDLPHIFERFRRGASVSAGPASDWLALARSLTSTVVASTSTARKARAARSPSVCL